MKIAFYTLGCKVNQYETQALKEKFQSLGYTPVEEQEEADIYVVNTCTVTGLADRKSRQFIRRVKRNHPNCVTAVIGCYAQANPDEVAAIEGVDIVLGTNEKNALPQVVKDFIENRAEATQIVRVRSYEELIHYEETGIITNMESRTRAYIKVQEGCDRFCSYCIIPYARGIVRSRAPKEIVAEAESLIRQGFKEIVITGINTALYGTEDGFRNAHPDVFAGLEDAAAIEGIIAALDRLPGDFRIRLGSLEPTVINRLQATRLTNYPKLCPHMHLSLQSGSDQILSAMNRHYDRDQYLAMVKALREFDPGYGLTTDLIAGFPGETQEDLADSVAMIEEVLFHHVHVFPYSKRSGTKAADLMNHLAPAIKKERAEQLAKAASIAAKEFFKLLEGTTRSVLFEEYHVQTNEVSGFTDNYIKLYCELAPGVTAEQVLNRFCRVTLGTPYLDGIKGYCENVREGV